MMSFICSLPLISALFSTCLAGAPAAIGYVEGDYVRIAPVESARVVEIAAKKGDHVDNGAILVRLEADDASAALAMAEAGLRRAEAELADLIAGKRPVEIEAIEASLAAARARAEEAEREANRQAQLVERRVAAQANLERAQTEASVTLTQAKEIEAQLRLARLPPRHDARDAARAAVREAEAAVRTARWKVEQRTLTAPAAATVADVLREPGELAGPASPVLSLLPDGAVYVVAFVPEAAFAGVDRGDSLGVSCNGCPEGLTAEVTFVATEPEFTPPVIYSLDNRQKLVWRIEARPDPAAAMHLKPGQIVDVLLTEPDR